MFEAKANARRPSLPTVPESGVRRKMSASIGEWALDKPKLTWAVDLGVELLALSTFDLWYALRCGDISSDTKVWRVGLEAWTAAISVPELACALSDSVHPEPRHTLNYAFPRAADSHDEVLDHELSALDAPCSELTPSPDPASVNVTSVHPGVKVVPSAQPPVSRPRRLWPAAVAIAAALALPVSFTVSARVPEIQPSPVTVRSEPALPATELVTAARDVGVRLRDAKDVKSWSPTGRGQTRERGSSEKKRPR